MDENQSQEPKKFYSQKSIGLATYLGGPLAAGILVRRNFINLGKEDSGKSTLFIGIVSTVILFGGILAVPEDVIDKVPNFVIPIIYTAIIYFIVDRLQGEELKEHEENQGQFYSAWKAAGVGVFSLAVILIGVFGYIFLAPEDFDTTKYDEAIAEFSKNEDRALELFNILDEGKAERSSSYISTIGISSWEKNVELLNDLDNLEGLTQDFKDRNQLLREYCQLRIESYELIRKALKEDTDTYNDQIALVTGKIEGLLTKLQ